jgi:hypothetical protein
MAATYTARINGVDRAQTHVLLDGFSIHEITNGINTLVCKVGSEDASYRPAKRQTIEIEEDDGSSPPRVIFGGTIRIVREHGWGEIADGIDGIILEISADAYQTLAMRRFATESVPAGTLKAALQILEPYLTAYGVTLDPAQVDGPTLDAIEWEAARVDDALNFLATLTAKYGAPFTWTIGYDLVLGMYQTGTIAAPWDLDESDFTTTESSTGDIEVEPTDDNYANKIILIGGSGQVVSTSDTFTADGTTNVFPLTYDLVGPLPGSGYGAVGQGIVIVDGVTQTLFEVGVGGAAFTYDPATNSISSTSGPPSAGTTIVVPYDGILKFTVIAQDAAEIAAVGLWEDKILATDVEDPALAQSLADAELQRRISTGRIVRFQTRRLPAPVPGETIAITVPKRNVSGNFTVTDVDTANDSENANTLIRTVTCNSTIHEQEHQTLTRWWSDKDTGGGIAMPAGSPGVPAPPQWSNQWNNYGRFGGDGAWTFVQPELLARLVGPDAEVLMRGMRGGLNYGVPALPAAVATRIGSVSTSRLYLSSTAAGYTPPTFKGDWDDTSESVTKKLVFTKADLSVSHAQAHESVTTAGWDLLNYRGVSDALTAQTISGTLSAMIVAYAGVFANHEMYWHIHLYATVGDSDSVRHTFISDYRENSGDGTRFPNAVNWGGYPLGTDDPLTGVPDSIPLTSGAILTGDRLVIEIGVVARNTLGGTFHSSIGYGARADRSDAFFRSAIDTSSWIDLNLSNPTSDQVVQAWSNTVAPLAEGDALTLEVPNDGTAWFKNDKGIYINGILFGGSAGNPPAAINAPSGFVLLTAPPSSPADDTWWVERSGTSPTIIQVMARFSGTTYRVAAITV